MSVPPVEGDAVVRLAPAGLHALAGRSPRRPEQGTRPEKPQLGLLPWGQGRVPGCFRKNWS